MKNTKDTPHPIAAMNMALDRLAKALMLNNQRSGKNVVQNVGKMNGISVDTRIANQHGVGNVVTARAEVKPKKLDVAYLQKQIQIAQKEEAGIHLTQVEFDFMADACASKENGSIELDHTKEKLETCIIKKEKEYVVLWNNWYTKCEECKYDKISYDKAYTDMQTKIERLQAQLGDLKGKSSNTQCASNTLDPVSQKLEDEKVSLEFQFRIMQKKMNILRQLTGTYWILSQ
ncbi:hypothetical protein Tco_1125994 [Tanacetum coccineum]